MSPRPTRGSADLDRLVAEQFCTEVRAGYLLVYDVPYANHERQVKRGLIVMSLDRNEHGGPATHVADFAGDVPCDHEGRPLSFVNGSQTRDLGAGVVVDHSFSGKHHDGSPYVDFFDKVETYVHQIESAAARLEPGVSARTGRVVDPPDGIGPFLYDDTATSRAEIGAATDKLRLARIAIIGLGGTGAYILDAVVKTPVMEIHLFDRDFFLQHNAFRSPAAASRERLADIPRKVDYYAELYSAMRTGIVPHRYHITGDNVTELDGMDYVFLAVDGGAAKRPIVDALEFAGISFIDTGMGLEAVDGAIGGQLRVTTSTPDERGVLHRHVSLADVEVDDDYNRNIQVSDLNMLNAALAVVRWKKLCDFYRYYDHEHHRVYVVDGNMIQNEGASQT
jgi:hypothetical protein